MPEPWTGESLLAMGRSYQGACVLLAAVELDLFGALADGPLDAERLATAIGADRRATRILADALVALGLLEKRNGAYAPAPGIAPALSGAGPDSVRAMLRHQGVCLRSWAWLAATSRAGEPVEDGGSIHGAEADRAAFIEAMEVASRHAAPRVVAALGPPRFRHLLDVGGGPGTWTIAFLQAVPGARATLYDLPQTLPIARRHLEAAGLAERVELVAGDFYADAALPAGTDLAWVSAIVHQNSRAQNRDLFAKVHAALAPGGEILIRDMVMDASRTRPAAGALFAVNMLARTEGGATYSLAELSEDLAAAGFAAPALVRGEREMDSVLRAARL